MAAQADVPGLLSRLAAVCLANSGAPENEISQRQVYMLKMMAGILGSNAYARSGLEGGGDDTALLHTLRKEMEAAGADKSKLDKLSSVGEILVLIFPDIYGTICRASARTPKPTCAVMLTELCNRLSPSGGRPGLTPRLRTSLLVLLRQLHREGRQMGSSGTGGRIAPTFSLTQAVQLGGLPPTFAPPPAPFGMQHQQQQAAQQQQQQRTGFQRPSSVASSYAGSASGAPVLRPTSVLTPSEMGDDPMMLSVEGSRASLMGAQGVGGGAGGEGEYLTRSSSFAAMPGAGPSGDPFMTGAGANMSATTEPSLVRDVLYAAQGVRGRVVGWVPGLPGAPRDLTSGFRPDGATAAGLGPGTAMLLERLTELGWLFRRVREHISACSGYGQASVRQALGAALAAEVGDYYRLLALLEAQARVPLPTPAGGGQYLTLRRLVCWLSEPLRRMRLLAAVGDAAEGLEGGALAGAVYEFSRHGDPFVAANAAKLLQQVCVPLYGIIRRWVLEGQLDDPYNEFFVVQHAAAAAVSAALAAANTAAAAAATGVGGVPGSAAASVPLGTAAVPPHLDLWRQSYGLDESRLPPFIGPSLAQRILRAGKAIHYLNLACGDGGWVQQRAEAWAREPPAATAAAAPGGTGELAGLEGLVSAAVRSVDERLMTVIWRHHRLRAHFAAIRRFLLLGQGDWVTAFMDMAQRELDKPASDVSEVQLNSCLRQALIATNVPGGAAAGGGGGGGAGLATVNRGLASAAAAGLMAMGLGGGGGGGFGAVEGPGGPSGPGGGGGEYGEADDDAAAMGMLVERLRVRKEKAAGAGETGWDVFGLTYNPAAGLPSGAAFTGGAAIAVTAVAMPIAANSGPLSALFTRTAMLSYEQLARLLWRLKRAEHALSSTWGAAACGLQRMVDKMGADGFMVQPVLAMLLRLRSDMSHFATNLQYYIQFEVMEASWQDFYSRAAACTDLDSLIAAHEVHLATLLRKAFLSNDGPVQGGPAGAGSMEGSAAAGGAAAAVEGAPGQAAPGGGTAGGAPGPSMALLRRALQQHMHACTSACEHQAVLVKPTDLQDEAANVRKGNVKLHMVFVLIVNKDALSNMVSLRAVAARLEELVAGGARLLAARATQAKARMARGDWGNNASTSSAAAAAAAGGKSVKGLPGLGGADPPIAPSSLADVRQTLVELGAQHTRAVAEFTENLPEEASRETQPNWGFIAAGDWPGGEARKAQDDVRFLLARLDFSAKGVQTSGSLVAGLAL
ncbi:gamma tubulin interacting protein [Volvox carteri f. nagariensis]|uniref:Gamma tubulin interacting protein n=1 Tax=Volvox carteri f. nagariensis TaxID=3068 RepID=D8UDV1_VOLCA|nr:gamma tubulin interacting protein [Volvox carteri f. nagariensis]EFJ42109.1 gamma tubulin interacting protein [Volvox carteri f. nagariensis]|eukprot:XP_002956806.1 gamma tubulin interacting protein [Volvox carteri f. nagariensis]